MEALGKVEPEGRGTRLVWVPGRNSMQGSWGAPSPTAPGPLRPRERQAWGPAALGWEFRASSRYIKKPGSQAQEGISLSTLELKCGAGRATLWEAGGQSRVAAAVSGPAGVSLWGLWDCRGRAWECLHHPSAGSGLPSLLPWGPCLQTSARAWSHSPHRRTLGSDRGAQAQLLGHCGVGRTVGTSVKYKSEPNSMTWGPAGTLSPAVLGAVRLESA